MGNLLYQIRAVWKVAKQDYAKAIEMFEKVIADEEKNPGIYTSLAYCYKKLNDLDTAMRYCKDAIDIDPNHYEALKLLSLIHAATQNYEEAYLYVKRALANQNKTLTEPPKRLINFGKKLSKFSKLKNIEQDITNDWPVPEEVEWLNWAKDFIKKYETDLSKKSVT